MSAMLTELHIEGFRCFQLLTAKPLGRVNLLVGKNNSGKTAFLDAVELAGWHGLAPPVFRSLLRRKEYARNTYEESPGKILTQFEFYPANLFHSHRLSDNSIFKIRCNDSEFIVCYENASKVGQASTGRQSAQLLAKERFSETWYAWDIDSDGAYRLAVVNVFDHVSKSITPMHFLSTERSGVHTLSKLWDDVQLTDEEALIPNALRFLEPNIEKVGRRGEGENLHFVVKLKGDKELRRLGTLGDGIRHMLALALHLIPAQNGYLLIDEIDLGLHHSVMAKMWRMLIESARRLNIQVFATTHSIDCINALAEVQKELNLTPEDLMLHRLEADLHQTISYTPEEIVDAAKYDAEVR